jgi:hypothetical protein
MIRGVLFSVALSGLLIYGVYRMVDMYQDATPARVTRVDIYSDHIAYRTSNYPTPSRFAIGLQAANDPPRKLSLHDCARMDTFEAVVEILRKQGFTSFDIELPDDC